MTGRAAVLPMSDIVATWSGRFAFHPVSEPVEISVHAIHCHQPKEKRA